MMVDALAKRMGCNLRQHGVSLISVEGLNFDSFLPLFGDNALKIPVAVLTDADPVAPKADPASAAADPVTAAAASAVAPTAAPIAGEDTDEEDDEIKLQRLLKVVETFENPANADDPAYLALAVMAQ